VGTGFAADHIAVADTGAARRPPRNAQTMEVAIEALAAYSPPGKTPAAPDMADWEHRDFDRSAALAPYWCHQKGAYRQVWP